MALVMADHNGSQQRTVGGRVGLKLNLINHQLPTLDEELALNPRFPERLARPSLGVHEAPSPTKSSLLLPASSLAETKLCVVFGAKMLRT